MNETDGNQIRLYLEHNYQLTSERCISIGLAALCQVLNNGKEYEWSLEVSFAKRKDDGNWEKKLTYVLPGDAIDYGKAYKAVKKQGTSDKKGDCRGRPLSHSDA